MLKLKLSLIMVAFIVVGTMDRIDAERAYKDYCDKVASKTWKPYKGECK